MRGTTAKRLRKFTAQKQEEYPKHLRVNFKTAYRRMKKAYMRGDVV